MILITGNEGERLIERIKFLMIQSVQIREAEYVSL